MSGTKRPAADGEDRDGARAAKRADVGGENELTQASQTRMRSFIKYSQNMDVSKVLGLRMSEGEVSNGDGDKVLYLPMGKNVKIRRKLESIFEYLKDSENESSSCKEIVMIASGGDAVQKMVSIVEIVKQKVEQLQNLDGEDGVKNNCKAQIPEENEGEKLRYNYTQLNYVDYVLAEEKPRRRRPATAATVATAAGGGTVHDKETLREVLQINKLSKVPVMYVYMHFYREESLPVKYVSQLQKLAEEGWSMQHS